ncbi:unnamed protein product [Tilletia controversa]|uniref:NADH dehydrogenase [ubiquinone] 1 beta subcomplex subunit 4 n=3 Tax=Tilletia TaxID=13289 RepID=A0A8X7SXJ1_9BASI|nr:hypothetical protein CF336_g3140 [Tilletia laevis]KAE8200526.1 hypothetical protein CF328_g2939 [Tilletia controversa]KAE8264119.1 hypothetical protein A4X03_0g1177 [Tilletia caries]KAE8205568.1 hypothetical protein CF335_g2257 [Tilletia laevis]KAE8248473.1 hypothetical protein A4X06_0g3689 [Tilletia controversa]
MAGGGDYHPVKLDPAIERHQANQTTMYTRFRLTGGNSRFIVLWGIAVPFGIYALAKATDGAYDWRSKTRADSLSANPPAPAPEE